MTDTLVTRSEKSTEEQVFSPPKGDGRHDLDELSWLEFQITVANEAIARLEEAADALVDGEGKREKRVHNMRIAFRRWYSVWSVLSMEGFESDSFKEKLGRKIKKTYKLLGTVRDWDVTINHGRKFEVPAQILSLWMVERDAAAAQSRAALKKLDLKHLITKLHKYMEKRARKLASQMPENPAHRVIARAAIEAYLMRQEEKTRELAGTAETLEDLHQLRLSIKAWRYLLVEFYTYTCEKLVDAQQILGQILDLERLRALLAEERHPGIQECIAAVVEKQNELIAQLDSMKEELPYGLRPTAEVPIASGSEMRT